MKINKPETAGWIGVAIVMALYTLAVNGVVTATSFAYLSCNIVGGSLIAVSCWAKKAWPAVVLNLLFVLISVLALTTILG